MLRHEKLEPKSGVEFMAPVSGAYVRGLRTATTRDGRRLSSKTTDASLASVHLQK